MTVAELTSRYMSETKKHPIDENSKDGAYSDDYVTWLQYLVVNNEVLDLVSSKLIDDRCESVLAYLIPDYKSNMSAEQYKNAMTALRTIYYGNQ